VKFIIERSQAQEILNYLQHKPYLEVHKLISLLVSLPPYQDPKAHAHQGGADDTSEVHESAREV